jgi:Homeodomain-like domain
MNKIGKTLANLLVAAKDHTDALVRANLVSLDELKYVFADRQARARVAKKLAEEGMSTRKIAAIVGVSKDTIRNDIAGENSPITGENSPSKADKRAARELELATKQAALPNKRYGLILADPEWRFEPYSRADVLTCSCVRGPFQKRSKPLAAGDVAPLRGAPSLREFMSSIMRWRSGVIVSVGIGNSCLE